MLLLLLVLLTVAQLLKQQPMNLQKPLVQFLVKPLKQNVNGKKTFVVLSFARSVCFVDFLSRLPSAAVKQQTQNGDSPRL
jgi:hypothetical protein